MRKRNIALAALVLSAAYAPLARAQGNDRSSPTGGRTALMGSTGVALAKDGSAPFLNPATIVRIEDQRLAFAVNFFTIAVTHFSDWHEPAPADARFGKIALGATGVSANRISGLPSTLCFFFTLSGLLGEPVAGKEDETPWHRGRQKLAVCLATLESEDVTLPGLSFRSPTGNGTTAQVESVTRRWNRTHVGPTYSVQLNDTIAIGASLHAAYTTSSFIYDTSSVTSANGGDAIQSTLGAAGDGHSMDLTAILGATYRAGRVTLGASMQVPSVHVFGNYSATLHDEYAAATGGTAVLSNGSGSFTASPPVRLSLGAGSTWNHLTVEADASIDFAQHDALRSSMHVETSNVTGGNATPSTLEANYAIRMKPVINFGLGAERFVSKGLSILAGVATNLSALPVLAPSASPSLGNLVQARTHRVTASVGLGSYTDAGEILVGTQLGYGWGQALAVNPYAVPNDWSVVGTQSYSALLIVAGATNLRAIKRAVEKVKDAVSNPDAPANALP